jgi:hypothetical protein
MSTKLFKNIKNIKNIKKLLNSLAYVKVLDGKKIIFFTIRSYSLVLHQELFLAYQLAELGASVELILDDGLYSHWDNIQEHDNTEKFTIYNGNLKDKLIKKTLAYTIIQSYTHQNIKIVWLSTFLKNKNRESIDNLTTLEKQQAESSVRRFFETGSMDLDIKSHQKYYTKSLNNCALSKTIAKEILLQSNPDLFITSHGIYSVWGPSFNYMKSNSIPSLVYGAHAYKSQEIIISDVIAQVLSQDSDWKKFEIEHTLTEDEKNKVINYFDGRINFKASDTKIYYGDIKSFETINIEKKLNSKTFVLFPNIIWDGDVYERDTIFKGIIDWVVKTVDIFKNSPHNLVIRFHPAEATLWKDSKPLEGIIRETISDIDNYENIYLISADKKINTYDFILNNIDIGLVYDGVLAMEMSYIKKPVIACAMSRYTGAGFADEPKSLKEYATMLSRPQDTIDNFNTNYTERKEKLLKYAYWYFYVCGYNLPIFDKNKILTISYDNLKNDEIDMNKNSNLKRTISKFISHIK